jgi:hypothetical protein
MNIDDFVFVAANAKFFDTATMVPYRRRTMRRVFGNEAVARVPLVETCGVASGAPLILRDVIFTDGVLRPAPGRRALNTWRQAA